jgi:hypothetical protein
VAVGAGLPAALVDEAAVISGQEVSTDFGTVVNAGNNLPGDGTIVIEILARVCDVPGNFAGATLTNASTVVIASHEAPTEPGGTGANQSGNSPPLLFLGRQVTRDCSVVTTSARGSACSATALPFSQTL